MHWGVRVEGSSVVVCADGLSAFREESWRRGFGDFSAVAVYSLDGVEWFPVPWDSPLRPDPWPPVGARRVWWWERFVKREWFK